MKTILDPGIRQRFGLNQLEEMEKSEPSVALEIYPPLAGPAQRLERRGVEALHSTPVSSHRRLGWMEVCKLAFVGASVSFVDASRAALNPVAFLWEHMDVIAKGFLYVLLPLLVTMGWFHFSPEIKSAYPPHSWQGAGFVLLMYAASAFTILLSVFSATFVWKAVSRLMKGWVQKGAETLRS